MNSETRTCESCSINFEILPKDFAFYEKMKVSSPKICERCAIERTMSLRNERSLYQRKCDKCGKLGLSIYHPKAQYVVYCHDCWWKDDWSGKDYAMEYDEARPIFEQFLELQARVPREALVIVNSTNADYGNHVRDSKDVYFSFLIAQSENVLYSVWLANNDKDVIDCHKVVACERVSDSVDLSKCSSSAYIQDSSDSVDCYFSYGLKGCNNCLFSYNLRNRSNCIRNQQVTPEEFQAEKNRVMNGSWQTLQVAKQEYQEIRQKSLRRYSITSKSSDVTGNNLEGCGSLRYCFEGFNAEHSNAVVNILNAKEIFYSYAVGPQPAEYIYGSSVIKGGSNIRFCYNLLTSSDCVLSDSLISSTSCIASVGLKHGEYSILNRQYDKEEFLKIQEKLLASGELSDFPPFDFSTFAYNETPAQDAYPKTEEGALSSGYRWQHDTMKTLGKETMLPEKVPDNIHEVDENILKEIFKCTNCDRNYRIVKAELELLKSFPLPLPRHCPQCRMDERRAMRRPFELYERACQCGGARSVNGAYVNTATHEHGASICLHKFQTSCAPDRPEIVYCERCYQEEVV